MGKKRKKTRREIEEELLRTDENFRRLHERILELRAAAQERERRDSS